MQKGEQIEVVLNEVPVICEIVEVKMNYGHQDVLLKPLRLKDGMKPVKKRLKD